MEPLNKPLDVGRAEVPGILLRRYALLIVTLSVVLSVAVGAAAYLLWKDKVHKEVMLNSLNTARLLALHARMTGESALTPQVLNHQKELWGTVETSFPGSYLCEVEGDGTLCLHAANPATTGNFVGDNRIKAETSDLTNLSDLLTQKKDWAGYYVGSTGEDQVAAFAYVPGMNSLIAVHVPVAAVEAEFRGRMLPWLVAFAVIVFGLLPLSTGLMHRVYSLAQTRTGDTIREVAARADELRASDERLRLVMEGTNDGIWEWTIGTGDVVWSERVFELFRMRAGSFGGSFDVIEEMCHPDDRTRLAKALHLHLENDEPYRIELRFRRGDDSYGHFFCQGKARRDQHGKPIQMVGSVSDITDRKKAEADLRRFRLIADSSRDFIGMCDLQLQPIYVNPEGLRLVGLDSLEAACRVKVPDYFFPEDRAFITDEFFPRVLRDGHGQIDIRLQHFQTGATIWMDYYLFHVKDPSGAVIGWATVSRNIDDRRRAEQALRESEERLRLALNAAHMGAWSWDIATHQTTCSSELGPLFGLPAGVGTTSRDTFLNCIHPVDRSRFDAVVEGVLKQDKPYDLEYRVVWPDGGIHWLASRGQLHRDSAGRPLKVVGVVMDITERMQNEEARRTSEAGLAAAQSQAKLGSWEFFISTQTAKWSAEMSRLHGRDPAQGPPTLAEILESLHPEDRQTVETAHARVVAGGGPGYLQYRVVRPDGSVFWAESRWEMTFDEAGQMIGMAGTLQDISDRKTAEEALRESEERLRLALDAAHMGIFDWAVPNNRITWSRWHEELWGFAPGEFAGTYEAFASRVHSDDLPGINAEVARCIAAREPFSSEFRVVWPDGSLHWILGTGEFQFGTDGQPVRMRGVVTEITERKLAESALRELNQRFRIMFEKAPFSAALLTLPTGAVVDANEAFSNLVGYTRQELDGKTALELGIYSLETRKRLVTEFEARGVVRDLELTFRVKSGDTRIVHINSDIVEIGGEKLVLSTAKDVTEQKQAEQALQESHGRLRAILDNIFSFVGLLSLDGILLDANRAPLQAANLRREDVIGKPCAETYWFTHSHSVQAELRDALARASYGEDVRYDTQIRVADGRLITIDVMFGPLRDSWGKIVQVVGSAVDITDRKQAEELLVRRARQQASIAELGQKALSKGTIQELLDRAVVVVAEVLEVELCKTLECLPDSSFVLLRSGIGWREGLVGRARIETDVRSQAGCTLLAHMPVVVEDLRTETRFSGPPLLHDHGVISGVSCIIGDCANPWGILGAHTKSRRRFTPDEVNFLQSVANVLASAIRQSQGEAALHEANQRLNFLSQKILAVQETERRNLARELHDEIGQVLTVIKIKALAAQRPGGRTGQAEMAEIIGVIDSAVQQVRNLSLNLRPSMLDDFGIEAALEWYINKQAKDVPFQMRLESNLGEMRFTADIETACFRIVQEALTNTMRYAKPKVVQVTLNRVENSLQLTISDDGIGFNVKTASERAARGGSVGLLGMQERVKLAGGQIDIISAPNRGTEIRVRFSFSNRSECAQDG